MDLCVERKTGRAFSLPEALIAVAALAVLASIAVSAMVGTHAATRESKLRGDVTTINAAIQVYLASGGDLGGAKTADQVISKLKAKSSADRARRLTGLSSSVVDDRLAYRMQSASEAAGSSARGRWNQAESKFVVETSGNPGIKEFYFNEAGIDADDEGQSVSKEAQAGADERAGRLMFAKESGWIWDYQDNSPDVIPGPTVVPLGTPTPPPPYVPPVALVGSPAPTTSPIPLAEPVFSPSGGVFPLSSFPLPVTLTNPNPPGVSKLAYSIDSNNWQDYAGSISLPSGANVRAMAVALDPDWTHSGMVTESYQEETLVLLAPVISPSADNFGLFVKTNITVTLVNPNPGGTSITRYRVNGSAWQDYNSPFILDGDNYLSGATVEAQAISSGPSNFLPSPVAQRGLGRESLNLSGSATGVFSNPGGPSGMVTNLAAGGSNSLFEWGDASGASNLSKSWMEYSSTTFGNISDSVRFGVGSLTYYNGTIMADSGATTIDLRVTLSLDISGTVFTPFFDFTFDLVNSQNVAGDEWGSADYVRLNDPRASRTLVLNGYEFEFRLEFGQSTSDGFAAFDEFHVLENKDASVAVFGTLISLGPVTSNTNPLEGGSEVAADAGTGTIADAIYQKQGYVDAKEYSEDLKDDADASKKIAEEASKVAESGLAAAEKANQEIAAKIADEKYIDAAKLAVNAKNGAIDAKIAALAAEQAASEAAAVAAAADLVAAENPDAQEQANKANEAAVQAAAFAADARAAADESVTLAAIVAGIANDFKTESLAAGSGEEDDYVEYLSGVAKTERDNAQAKRDAAKSFDSTAGESAVKASDKLSEGKDDEARDFVILTVTASASAEQAAQAAEDSTAAADAAAAEAQSIAAGISDGDAYAAATVSYADEARVFASEARGYADMASFAALQAISLPIGP